MDSVENLEEVDDNANDETLVPQIFIFIVLCVSCIFIANLMDKIGQFDLRNIEFSRICSDQLR